MSVFNDTQEFKMLYLPWCSTVDWFPCSHEHDIASDNGEYSPHHNKSRPVKLDTEEYWDHPHP